MNVVVTTFGSDGDVNPLLAIASALVRRGAAVSFVANPFYERRVKSTGSRFVGAGKYLDIFAALEANAARYLSTARGGVAIWKELAVPSLREIYPVVRETVRDVGATAVVSHVLSYGAVWAAAETGARSAVVTTSSSAWLSRHHPLVFANWRAPRLVQGAFTAALRVVGERVLRRVLRPLAAELGVPPMPDIVPVPDLNLGVWPEWYRSPAPDDPPRSRMCGFVFDTGGASQALPPEVESFLAAGDPPIVAGFGSAASLHAAARYRAVADACGKLGRRCVLIGASAGAVASDRNVIAVRSAPYARMFPAASAVIHHGGFGTCAEALRAGKPSLVTPFAFDQFDTAARLQDAGLGRWLAGKADDAGALAAALDSVLRDAPLQAAARDAAAKIAAVPDGADRAAELIAAL